MYGSFREIRYGNFDKYLLYPQNPVFHLVFSTRMYLMGFISNILFASVIFGYIINFYSLKLILFGMLFVLFGTIIYLLFRFALISTSFWTKNERWIGTINMTAFLLIRYPMTLTHKTVQFMLMFIIPLFFIATVPAEFIRGNLDFMWIIYGIFMLGAMLIISKIVWRKGLANYESGMG